MDWKRMLAWITGSVDRELLGRNEYLIGKTNLTKGHLLAEGRAMP